MDALPLLTPVRPEKSYRRYRAVVPSGTTSFTHWLSVLLLRSMHGVKVTPSVLVEIVYR